MLKWITSLFVVGCFVGGPWAIFAQAGENWPAWRKDGSGIADQKQLPVFWSDTENVKWRTVLPGDGNSSPIVLGNRVFLTASLDEGAKRLIICFDADSGEILWQTKVSAEIKTDLYSKTGFAAPTPATDGQRVYAFFDTPGLVAVDTSGNVVWKRRLGPFQSPYNMASSPIIYKDMVIQCCDHSGASFLVAFDAKSGQQRWRTPRKSSEFGHFGTPLVIEVKGRPQLVVNAEPVVSYDPDTGKELWSCRGMKECVAPSPAFGHDFVYASSGRSGPVMAIDPTGRGDVTETNVHLHLTSGGPYVPTPLVYPHLMVPGDNGKMLFYDGAGKLVVEDRVSDHFSASPVGGDDKIYWCSERGKTYVLDAKKLGGDKPSVKVLAVNKLSGLCLATPAIVNSRLLIRTSEALYCIAGTGKAGAARPAVELAGTFAELKERFDKQQATWKNERSAQVLETLEAIARMDDPQVVPFLLHTVQREPHSDIIEEAAKSLGRKGEAGIDSLIALLGDYRTFVRVIAISELGRLKAAKAVPGLLIATRDKDPLVRAATLQALTNIGGEKTPQFPDIVIALTAAFGVKVHEELVVKHAALDGLAALGSKIIAQREPVVTDSALGTRKTSQRDNAVTALVVALGDGNSQISSKASETLDNVYHATPEEIAKLRASPRK
jgi:outer membrane protein assembly factor BamB